LFTERSSPAPPDGIAAACLYQANIQIPQGAAMTVKLRRDLSIRPQTGY